MIIHSIKGGFLCRTWNPARTSKMWKVDYFLGLLGWIILRLKNYPVPAAFLVDSSLTVETLEAETLASKLFQTPLRLTSSEMLISGMSLATGILTTLPLARIRNEPYERKRGQTQKFALCLVWTTIWPPISQCGNSKNVLSLTNFT